MGDIFCSVLFNRVLKDFMPALIAKIDIDIGHCWRAEGLKKRSKRRSYFIGSIVRYAQTICRNASGRAAASGTDGYSV